MMDRGEEQMSSDLESGAAGSLSTNASAFCIASLLGSEELAADSDEDLLTTEPADASVSDSTKDNACSSESKTTGETCVLYSGIRHRKTAVAIVLSKR